MRKKTEYKVLIQNKDEITLYNSDSRDAMKHIKSCIADLCIIFNKDNKAVSMVIWKSDEGYTRCKVPPHEITDKYLMLFSATTSNSNNSN